MSIAPPFNFNKWIEENRPLLKPPVANKCVYSDGTFIVMVVGGPNERTDFHVNQTDEFFYQIHGNIYLRIINSDKEVEEIHIKEGDVFMLPAGVPHSPQRPEEGSVGLVVELNRPPQSRDALQWYCAKCTNLLYQEDFYLENIETQFGAVFDKYFGSEYETCKECGHQNGKEWNP